MYFQFSRFWQNYGFTSQLDTLLEKKDCTLEQILDEENILAELKSSGAQKFAKFVIAQPHRYRQLIDYIIQFRDERYDQKIQIKYPFLVSEVFSTENTHLIDFLFDRADGEEEYDPRQHAKEDQENTADESTQQAQEQPEESETETIRKTLLPYLLNFLDEDSIYVTSAGYFNKTVVPIIKKRGFDFWHYLNENPQVISNLLKHIDITHIADIVQRLLILDTQSEQSNNNTFLQERINLLNRIVNMLKLKVHVPQVVENISNILGEIVQQGLNNNSNNSQDILALIEVINKPLMIFRFGVRNQSASSLQVLVHLLDWQRQKNSNKSNRDDEDMTNYQDIEEDAKQYQAYFEIPSEITDALESGDVGSQFTTTYGETIIPLNPAKMTVLNILYQLLQTGDQTIFERVARSHVFQTIQKLVLQHQFNNQVQNYLDKMITLIFENPKAFQLQEHIIADGFLTFLSTNNDNGAHPAGTMKHQVKHGYQGILTKLSNYLARLPADKSAALPKSDASWIQYLNGTLRSINEVESVFLCGVNPKAKQSQEDSDNHDQEVQSILSRFQQHRQEYSNQTQTQEPQQADDNDDNDNYHDAQEIEDHRDSSSSDEELVQEKINETISSPQSGPQEIAELIGIQEKLEASTLSPEQIEIKSDAEVNAYWKNHEEELQHPNQERKNSKDITVDFHKEEEKIASDEPVVAEQKAEIQETEVAPVQQTEVAPQEATQSEEPKQEEPQQEEPKQEEPLQEQKEETQPQQQSEEPQAEVVTQVEEQPQEAQQEEVLALVQAVEETVLEAVQNAEQPSAEASQDASEQ